MEVLGAMEKDTEKKAKAPRGLSGWEVLVFILATFGAVELRNQYVAGPFRSLWVDTEQLNEAVARVKEQMSVGREDKLPAELAASAKRLKQGR